MGIERPLGFGRFVQREEAVDVNLERPDSISRLSFSIACASGSPS